MKHIILFCLCLFCMCTAWTQKMGAPDYKKIEKEISQSSSPYYYDNLLQRYQRGDSTLTLEECRYVYFGQVFQSHWSPMSVNTPEKKYLLRMSMPDDLDTALAAIAKVETILKDDPFNLDILMIGFYLTNSDLVQDKERAEVFNNKIVIVLNAISSCGNGLTADDAFHVINISHEYAMASVLDLHVKSQALVGACDVLEMQENEYGIEKIYFNVSKILEYENRMFGSFDLKSKKNKKKNNK